MTGETRKPRAGGILKRALLGAAAGALALGAAVPASAKICNMRVYHASNGKRLQEAGTVFKKGDEFIVCFNSLANGYVSLWDRIPLDGPVERLTPSPHFEKGKSRAVRADSRTCFGDGKVQAGDTPYKLVMDAKDGVGLGRMWLVFSENAEDHPDVDSFDSASIFKDAYYERRFGAGSMKLEPGGAARNGDAPVSSGCTESAGSLDFFYRVVEPGES